MSEKPNKEELKNILDDSFQIAIKKTQTLLSDEFQETYNCSENIKMRINQGYGPSRIMIFEEGQKKASVIMYFELGDTVADLYQTLSDIAEETYTIGSTDMEVGKEVRMLLLEFSEDIRRKIRMKLDL